MTGTAVAIHNSCAVHILFTSEVCDLVGITAIPQHLDLRNLCKAAGVKVISPHGLRHSCTKIWVSFGASAEVIRRQLNQKDIETTMRYMHRTDDRLRYFAAQIVPPQPAPKLVSP